MENYVQEDPNQLLAEMEGLLDDNYGHFDELESHSTLNGSLHGTRVTNYEQVDDKSVFHAQEVRCCQCGIMMVPNKANTCIQCLKSKIDISEGLSKTV
mgnify:FL=1